MPETGQTSVRDQMAYSVVGLSSSADFSPEDCPEDFIEWTFRLPRSVAVGAGFYTLSFLRVLTPEEAADEKATYTALEALSPRKGG